MRDCATSLKSELAQDELYFLLETIKRSAFSGIHLEIGTAAGGTLWQMIKEAKKCTPFVVVDPMSYFPNQFTLVKKNLLDHGIDPSTVDFRLQHSASAFLESSKKRERFDFLFIDGNHKLKYIMQDLRWVRLLNSKGKIALHDYSISFPGVRIAVDRFLKKNPHYKKIGQVRDLLIIEKIAEGPREISLWDLFLANVMTPLLQLTRKRRLSVAPHRCKK